MRPRTIRCRPRLPRRARHGPGIRF
jgi:hypothetical protein